MSRVVVDKECDLEWRQAMVNPDYWPYWERSFTETGYNMTFTLLELLRAKRI